MTVRNFIDLRDISSNDLRQILDCAAKMKRDWKAGKRDLQKKLLTDHVLIMMFEKPSTRTRVSFDLAIRQLGGESISLNSTEIQFGRGESPADTARVFARFGQAIMLRANEHETLVEVADNAGIPVINGLTNYSHPCQIIADLQTFEEHKGNLEGKTIAWIGDGNNNVARSWLHAAGLMKFNMSFGCPEQYFPDEDTVLWAKSKGSIIKLETDAKEAVRDCDCVVTDAWVSMGDTDAEERHQALSDYQVNDGLMALADDDAIFMHCLPAHRGEEVTDSVMDGKQSVVFDEAENRLHGQKAVLVWCFHKVESV